MKPRWPTPAVLSALALVTARAEPPRLGTGHQQARMTAMDVRLSGHMQMIADPLAAAIVRQFPNGTPCAVGQRAPGAGDLARALHTTT
jgi:hypothetical protein